MPYFTCMGCSKKFMSRGYEIAGMPPLYCTSCFKSDTKVKKRDLNIFPLAQPGIPPIRSNICEYCQGELRKQKNLLILALCGHVYHFECLDKIMPTLECSKSDCKKKFTKKDIKSLSY